MLYFKKLNLLFFLITVTAFVSCKKNDVDPVATVTDSTSVSYKSVNQWIYETMGDIYFWSSTIPAQSNLDLTISPTDFFEKLIYQRTTTDRFSTITDDFNALQNEFNGVSTIFGISYSLSYLDDANSNIGLFLNLVVKGSPAEAAGLKRGDVIMKVNGTQLTEANYSTLLGNGETATFTLGTLNGTVFAANGTTISVTKTVVTEDPVVFSSIIDKSTYGKKIGYIAYTQFIPGNTSDASKYDNELRQIFANFKTNGVNELVLDLRYNGGGYISSAETLASLIGKNISSSKVFYKEQWNEKYTAYWQKSNGANALNYNFLTENNNIGSSLSRVFVLTSNGTASASELVINGLKPYMDVVTIGTHTYGKNLFGSLISDDQNRWNWGMYIMLGQTANANDQSDYGTVSGITPTYIVEDNVVPYKAFGDDNETLFKKALDVMGVPVSQNGRIAATKKVNSVTNEIYRDNLHVSDKRMIKNTSLKLFNQ